MHMLSKKGFEFSRNGYSAEIQDSTAVVSANGEVQTNEEAQVYVRDLDLFVTVITRRHACSSITWKASAKKNGYSYEWSSGKNHG